jgi:hypothetical protein
MRRLFVISTLLAAMSVQANESQFVQICMNGDAAGKGSCPSQPKPGQQPGDWSCTRDNKTNLVWSIESSKGSWDYARGEYSSAANRQSRCGFSSGWRLPTRNELLTIHIREDGVLTRAQALLNKNASSQPAVNARYFPATRADVYWTADTLAADRSMALFVYFKPGFDNEGNAYADSKSEENYIRLVHDPR